MTINEIREIVKTVVCGYPVKRVVLFGSRATEKNRKDSDVDLIMEFSEPVSLLQLSKLHIELELALGLDVDLIHGPLRKDDLLEVEKEVELYVA